MRYYDDENKPSALNKSERNQLANLMNKMYLSKNDKREINRLMNKIEKTTNPHPDGREKGK
jgi:hypothetical protein